MPDPDFSFLSNEQSNDVLAGIGAGLQAYDPNNMFAGAGAAISANTASRVNREEPYRQFQASLKNKKILQDMYAGKKANITDYGRLTQNMKDMLKEMFGKARPVADVPPVDVVAEQMKAFYDENVRNEPLMKQSMENDPEYLRRRSENAPTPPEDYSTEDPEYLRRGSEDAPTPPEDYSTARRPQSDEPNSGDDTQLEDLIRDVERESNPNSYYSDREMADRIDLSKFKDDTKFEPLRHWLLQRMQAVKDGAVNEIEKQQILREGRDYLANQKKKRWALRTGKVGN
jgi:hypothetical protein